MKISTTPATKICNDSGKTGRMAGTVLKSGTERTGEDVSPADRKLPGSVEKGARMNSLMLLGVMVCGGVAIAVQPSINGRLAQKTGVLESSCISFTVGALGLFLLALLIGRGSFRGIADTSLWELTGGLLGAFFVTMTIIVVPRLGTAAAMAAVIASQLITGLILDHYGFLGFRHIPFDTKRAIGVALLLAGAGLVFRR